jgi:hypothetical protein
MHKADGVSNGQAVSTVGVRPQENKNTAKQTIGRAKLSNGWTPERRAKQAEKIQSWKPWEQSTGPKTALGKSRAARNGFKGGIRLEIRALTKAVNQLLREQKDALQRCTLEENEQPK